MSTITRFTYSKLRREEQRSFNRRMMRIIEETFGADTKHFAEFKSNADKMAEILGRKGSLESTSLAELDKTADGAWTGLYYALQATIRHPDAAVREAASIVNAVFEKIKKPINLNYDQEYGALQTLLEMLSKLDASVLTTARVDEYVAHLQASVSAFITASDIVDDIKAKRIAGEMKEAANGCSSNWIALCKYIEAMADIDNAEAIEAVKRLDAITSAIKLRLEMRKTTKDTTNIIDDIA